MSSEQWKGADGLRSGMGVWERSPGGIAISMRNEWLLENFRLALCVNLEAGYGIY